MRSILLCLAILCLETLASGQIKNITHSVVNLGNVADIQDATAFAHALHAVLDTFEQEHTILFNGDVIREDVNFRDAITSLDSVITILRDPARRKLIFLPGDRDWDDSGMLGWDMVKLLENYIVDKNLDDVLWPLHHGCPGPERISLGLTLNMLVVNTQWWNHPYSKPSPASADCDLAVSAEVIEELDDEIDDIRFGNLIIAGHYPVLSNGEYGGRFPMGRWILPFPLVSTMQTAFRQNVGSPFETCNERFAEYKEQVLDLLKEYNSLLYLSGHEKTQEILNYYDNILINSGAPEMHGFLAKSQETMYAGASPGVAIVHFDINGNVAVAVYEYRSGRFEQLRTIPVLQAPSKDPEDQPPVNERLVPGLEDQYVLPEMSGSYPEEVTLAANPEYEAHGFKKWLLGEHYRETWITPVKVPYLDLDTTYGGLIPYQVGGGRQTQSLKITADDGLEYVFRSVDKDPSKALSYDLRATLISLIVRDQTTTQHPYGAVATSALLDHLDILHAHPVIRVMPDDDKLGPFQSQFGNMLGMLEVRPTGRKEVQKTFADADHIRSSNSMFQELYKDRDNVIADDEFARARMFDVLVGDWGKHEDNWRWAGYEGELGYTYRPVPRDRDHVFSRWDGFLPWLVDREWAKPSGENFDYEIKGLRSLMWQARHLDRFLASELDRDDWLSASEYIRSHLTDADIDEAMTAFPDAVEDIHGPEIAAKLKQRKEDLDQYANRYYDMLAKQVDIVGSIKNELFEVTRNNDGTVLVEMYKIRRDLKDKRFYSRLFKPGETEEIRLFGLEGEDRFLITGEARESIRIRIISGPGEDEIVDQSVVAKGGKKTHLYDLSGEDRIAGSDEVKLVEIPYEKAYYYRRTAFAYNTYFPYALILFSSGNGVQLSGGATFTLQSYNKPDFAARYGVTAGVSSLGNLRLELSGRWRNVLGQWDLTANTVFEKRRRFNYFFGIGNETTYDKELFRNDYYSLQYSRIFGEVGLLRTFWQNSSVAVAVEVSNNSGEKLADNIIDDLPPGIPGLSSLPIGKLLLSTEFDFRDRMYLPTRGMRLFIETYAAQILENEGSDYSMAKATLESFITFKPVTLGLKGGAVIHGGTPPYYDLHYLGQNTHLRGFRQNRFTGKKSLFLNCDLRIQIIDNENVLIPHKIGITLFGDVGRVYAEEEVSDTWHVGYGIGVYVVPIRERFAFQVSAGFSEEESGLIRLSFGSSF